MWTTARDSNDGYQRFRNLSVQRVRVEGSDIVAIPLAAGALAGYGLLLPPAVAGLFLSAGTVMVAINAQPRRRAKI